MPDLSPTLVSLKSDIERELRCLEGLSLKRSLPSGDKFAGSAVDFSASDYLGFRHDAEIKLELLRSLQSNWQSDAAVSHPALGSGASRLVFNDDPFLIELESVCSKALGFESSVYLPSGFSANMCFFDALVSGSEVDSNVAIFLEASSHASLFLGARMSRLPLSYFKYDRLQQLENTLKSSKAKHKIICIETLHSMNGTFAPIAKIIDLAQETNSLVFADEAHSFGTLGKMGGGVVADLSPSQKESILAVMIGFGKACGNVGGAIVTHAWFKSIMANKSRPLIYSTGPSPLATRAALVSVQHLFGTLGSSRRLSLNQNIELFRLLIPNAQLGPIQVISAVSAEASLKAQATLQSAGLIARAIRPPTVPKNQSRLRIIIQAQHSPQQIGHLCKVLTSLAHDGFLRF